MTSASFRQIFIKNRLPVTFKIKILLHIEIPPLSYKQEFFFLFKHFSGYFHKIAFQNDIRIDIRQ